MLPHLKNHSYETQLFRERAKFAASFTIFLIILLALRVFTLQIIEHDTYQTLSDNNRLHTRSTPPTRGNIYDRNGVLLATNKTEFRLEIISVKGVDTVDTIERLKPIIQFSDDDVTRFFKERNRSRRIISVPLRFSLTHKEVARFEVNRHKFPGVSIQHRQIRHYPLYTLTSHLIGYVGRIDEKELKNINTLTYASTEHIGKTGVELYYEDILHGTPGVRQVETNVVGTTIRLMEETPPTSGDDIFITIDSSLQAIADKAMGDKRGALVALNPKNGEILALLSKPSFNANLFVNGISSKQYNELINSKYRPLFNRFLHGQYPPGSTVKPLMALAGLEGRQRKPEHSTECRGWYQLKGYKHKYRDWKRRGHGKTDLDKAIIESCDVYFYDLAHDMGIDYIEKYLAQFGFGKKTGVDISNENRGVLPSRNWKEINLEQPWYPGETLSVGIGQGFFTTTPLQLASSIATLANYGEGFRPQLLYAIQGAGGSNPQRNPPTSLTPIPIKDRANWDSVHEAMRKVVHSRRGTARKLGRKSKYTIAGKTGTAQVYTVKQGDRYDEESLPEHLKDHALFVAFAPKNDPEIAIAVIIENGGHGGSVAAPIAKQVMDRYLLKDQI
ncbi:MAG: penicillin-binding protein 2 [Thiotrichales bacterium]|nr:penicillin-binding protein 2 [Thiotrichales bacterium]MBT3753307.1 penicillin-binding protein 2 [Thiotrichales bacterium]MBT3837290.1 penicillin-binding protein 2 [Thiotrichales bacterium]MBT4261437.1 penicillin-binding protein 2 [Thiotrichales bacterium]MBT4971119.1 penicillin-binding protein 2 [Thiotrichales bacterium]